MLVCVSRSMGLHVCLSWIPGGGYRAECARARVCVCVCVQESLAGATNDEVNTRSSMQVRKDRAGEYESTNLVQARAIAQENGAYVDNNTPAPVIEDKDGPVYNFARQEQASNHSAAGQDRALEPADGPVYKVEGKKRDSLLSQQSLTPSLRSSGSAPPSYETPPAFEPVGAVIDSDDEGDGRSNSTTNASGRSRTRNMDWGADEQDDAAKKKAGQARITARIASAPPYQNSAKIWI